MREISKWESEKADILSQIGLITVQESLTWPSICVEF